MLVFLDIDGVMVTGGSWKSPELLEDDFPKFSDRATSALQSLITVDTTVMLTTSHKSRFTVGEWKKIFEKRGVKIENLKVLESKYDQSRKDEILDWFISNSYDGDFVIIDDDKSLNDLPSYLKDHLILTYPLIGLTNEHLKQVNVTPTKEYQYA